MAVQLRTPVLNSTTDYCLTFFLHHVGDKPPPVIVNAEVKSLFEVITDVIHGNSYFSMYGKPVVVQE